MTNNQLNVILMTAKLGSISAAAKELGLSQPNASSCIKAVEDEVGFRIFQRTRDGITTTSNGTALLEQAQRISEANKEIQNIKEYSNIKHFRLGSVTFTSATDAFVKFCISYGDNKDISFSHHALSMEKGMEMLQNRQLDLFVALAFDEDDLLTNRICKERHLQKILIKNAPTAVTVRMGHPLLEQVNEISIKEGAEVLKPYPLITYFAQLDNPGETGHTYKTNYMPHTGLVLASELEERFSIVAKTDGYAAGASLGKDFKEKYGLIDIPITDIRFNVFCFIRETESDVDEIRKYLEFFREEVDERFREIDDRIPSVG